MRTRPGSLILALVLLAPAGCVKRQLISWADVTLRNYRDFPGLTISPDEWKRSAKLFADAAGKGPREHYEARRLFCEGKALQAAGQTEGALALFMRSSELDPAWALPYQAIGSIEFEKGSFDKAKTMFEKAGEADPMWTSPLADLGVVYHHLDEPLKALQYFEKAIAIDPSQGYLHSNRANVLTALGRYDEALKSHMEAVNLEPQNPIFYMNMAATLEEIKDLENELWVEKKLKDLLPEPQKLIVTLKVARILSEMGRYDEALSELKKAHAMSPSSKAVKDELKKFYFERKLYSHLIDFIVENSKPGCKKCAQECYDLGNKLLMENNLEGAQKAYEACIQLKPGWTGPVHNLGIVYYRRHDYKKAIDLFQQVLEAEKDDVSSILNTGMACYRMGRTAEALEWVGKAVGLKGDLAVAHSNLAEILRFEGKYTLSAAEHLKALSLEPAGCHVMSQYARLLLDTKKPKEAEDALGKAADDDCAGFHLVKAMLLSDAKKLEKAAQEIEITLAVDRSMAEAIALRGLVSFKKGDKGKAKEDLAAALCMEPRLAGEKRYKDAVKKLKLSPKCAP